MFIIKGKLFQPGVLYLAELSDSGRSGVGCGDSTSGAGTGE